MVSIYYVSLYSGYRIHKLRHLYHPLAPWVDDNTICIYIKKPFWTIASIIKTSSQSTRAQRGSLQRQSHHPPREELRRAPGGGHPGPTKQLLGVSQYTPGHPDTENHQCTSGRGHQPGSVIGWGIFSATGKLGCNEGVMYFTKNATI